MGKKKGDRKKGREGKWKRREGKGGKRERGAKVHKEKDANIENKAKAKTIVLK